LKIFFTGQTGSGKSTLAQIICDALRAKGLRFANWAVEHGANLEDTIVVYDPMATLLGLPRGSKKLEGVER